MQSAGITSSPQFRPYSNALPLLTLLSVLIASFLAFFVGAHPLARGNGVPHGCATSGHLVARTREAAARAPRRSRSDQADRAYRGASSQAGKKQKDLVLFSIVAPLSFCSGLYTVRQVHDFRSAADDQSALDHLIYRARPVSFLFPDATFCTGRWPWVLPGVSVSSPSTFICSLEARTSPPFS